MGIIKNYVQLLDKGYVKTIEIFIEIAQFDPVKFVHYLKDDFRESTDINLHKKLAKKYCSGGILYETKIRYLLEILLPSLKERKDFMDFYTGTFLVFIFDKCTKSVPILEMIFLFCEKIPESYSLNSLIVNNKVFEKVNSLIGTTMNKKEYMMAVKIIRTYLTPVANLNELQEK